MMKRLRCSVGVGQPWAAGPTCRRTRPTPAIGALLFAALLGSFPAGRCEVRRPAICAFLFAALLVCTTAAVAAKASQIADGNPELGRRLAERYHCGSCHTIPGVSAARGRLAISLDSFGQRSYIAGRIPNQAPLLARWIESPRSLIPDTAMPDMGVTPADARDIAAYLRQLK